MNKENKINIITATYNRGEYLKNIYKSICEQKYSNIQWVIVDDGSEDNTEEVVNKYISEGIIDIKYIKKENGGKHTALNVAIDKVEEGLVFIVDSDDILSKNSLEKINTLWSNINKKEYNYNIIGIGGLKGYINNNVIIGDKIPCDNFLDDTLLGLTYNYKVLGDKSIIFDYEVLKNYRFPEFKGEKFLTEAVVYNRIMNEKNKLRWVNEIFTLCEYLYDGLTKKYDEIMSENWNGTKLYFEELLNLNIGNDNKRDIIKNYLRYGYINNEFNSITKKYKLKGIPKLNALKEGIILSNKIKVKKLLRRK